MLFIIIFLVIGMAIMLRVRIDPRTVMTIQNQIPKIIIGVVMVTFSFAIAGFLIDMMWTSMYVSYGILSTVPGPNGAKYVDISGLTPQDMQATTPIGLVNSNNYHVLTVGGTQSSGVAGIANQLAVTLKDTVRTSLGVRGCDQGVGGVVGSVTSCLANFSPFDIIVDANEGNVITILLDAVSFVVATGTYIKVATMIAGESESVPLIGTLFSVSAGNGISLLAATGMYTLTEFILREILPWLIIFLVVYIAMFFALMRLWFELLKSFVFILFDVIFAPFWIMASLIPGNTSMGIGSWIKDLAANLAAFPAVAAMFILGKILMDAFSQPGSGPVFVPPLIGNSQDTHFLGAIIGLAVILSTPQVVTMIKKAIKAPEVKLGGVGAAIGFGAGAPKRMASGSLSSVFSPHIDKKTGSLTYPGGFFGQILRGFGATRG
jgi:hypothetical protein